MSFELVIHGGLVADGTGYRAFGADVGIRDGRIVKIGTIDPGYADELVDASDRVLAPGFIDMHSHSDFVLLVNPKAESKVRQGVTTEVVGNCGNSAAPI
ncbi:MAG: amidohydrolase family protein, partial [Candidatus Bathyarchaeota archaeon]